MSCFLRWVVLFVLCGWLCQLSLWAQDPPPEPLEPTIAPASDDGERAVQGFKIPAGWQARLFAAEPLVANPVSFFVDRRGRVFVCESFRQNAGVTDNRGHDQAWLDDDLAAQSVQDRLAYHQKHLRGHISEFTKNDDRIRLLVDTDGDKRANRSTVFANQFNHVVDGTGAGVLEHHGQVYYTCIPDLWQLRDEDGDGIAEHRNSLATGFGVRVAFRGHDLHGLIVGPDGRLYFSVGDRGYSVATPQGRLHDPESGAVFRCELDGSKLEVVATGLRNPQELAFDDYGNLFTGDNNSDSGDKARWVQIVEGGDSGWRMAYQYLPDRGPFNREKIWHPFHADQPAYIIPPIANLADGPSGLAFDPGTGLPDHFRGRFFLCDFRGGAVNSGIRTFRVERQGATFKLADVEQSFWNILATDVQFGPDGAMYVSDWVNGWNGDGKGRIYRFYNPAEQDLPVVREVQELLASDMGQLPAKRLGELLHHADRRVRQEAQFALAQRTDTATLLGACNNQQHPLGRLHGLWGLGQIARHQPEQARPIATATRGMLDDPDSEVRAQVAALLGELRDSVAIDGLIARLKDDDLGVRYHAAMGLGKLGDVKSAPAIFELLVENADRDPVVRHGAIMALAGMNNPQLLAEVAKHTSRSVRLAAVVALRRLKSPQVSVYLNDSDSQVVVEAARAVHDLPRDEAMPALASLSMSSSTDDALMRRVLNANFRLGGKQHTQALAAYAARANAPMTLRLEALDMLAVWETPSKRDRVLGMWRPISGPRSRADAAESLRLNLGGVLSGPNRVRAKGALVAKTLGLPEAGTALQALFADASQSPELRADAVAGLGELRAAQANDVVAQAITDESPLVRAAARRALVRLRPAEGIAELGRAVLADERIERQGALAALADLDDERATAAIVSALEQLVAGAVPADSRLDVLEAAARRSTPQIRELIERYESQRSKDDPLAEFRDSLVGGDAAVGERIFFERTELSCVRCHKIKERGGEVGPDLSRIATEKQREYLLESIVDPNRTIAKGFDSVIIVDTDGRIHAGVLRSENESEVRIVTADGLLVTVPKRTIDERAPTKSPMPDDVVKKMSKRELRDLVEFLANLK